MHPRCFGKIGSIHIWHFGSDRILQGTTVQLDLVVSYPRDWYCQSSKRDVISRSLGPESGPIPRPTGLFFLTSESRTQNCGISWNSIIVNDGSHESGWLTITIFTWNLPKNAMVSIFNWITCHLISLFKCCSFAMFPPRLPIPKKKGGWGVGFPTYHHPPWPLARPQGLGFHWCEVLGA